MYSQKNFIDELYPVGSKHSLPHPVTHQLHTAVIKRHVKDGNKAIGVFVVFDCDGRFTQFGWLRLNEIRAGIAEDAPMV